ncbi:MAG: TasA family protein [Patescibacteria group bacterium]|jgi:predicted ribosomally synthesized peptide with SipW-like signal peptide
MKRILLSLAMIAVVGSTAVGATRAYFSSTATITENTFATGTLEVRVNGQPTLAGAQFSAVEPGQMMIFQHNVNNYGPEHFAGLSNLSANKLLLNVTGANDFGSGLWQEVRVRVEVNRGWETWHQVYQGKLKDLSNVDLLSPRWTELAPGNSQDIKYTVWLPETNADQTNFMGKSLTWNFEIEGRTN